jgi:hypothetical protein
MKREKEWLFGPERRRMKHLDFDQFFVRDQGGPRFSQRQDRRFEPHYLASPRDWRARDSVNKDVFEHADRIT